MADLLKITIKTLVIIFIILVVIYGTAILGEWLIGLFAEFRQAVFF